MDARSRAADQPRPERYHCRRSAAKPSCASNPQTDTKTDAKTDGGTGAADLDARTNVAATAATNLDARTDADADS